MKETGAVPGRDGRAPKAVPRAPSSGVWTAGFLQACAKASRKTLILPVLDPSRNSGIGYLTALPSYVEVLRSVNSSENEANRIPLLMLH